VTENDVMAEVSAMGGLRTEVWTEVPRVAQAGPDRPGQ
jgi:hypothetical protein